KVDDKCQRPLFCRWCDLLSFHLQYGALYACAESNARGVSATEYFGQAIITSSTIKRQFIDIGCELEYSACVVIQPAHNQWIELIRHTVYPQKTLNGIKMLAARLAQVINNLRCGGDLRLILWLFAV